MSRRYIGARISATAPTIALTGASGAWTLQSQMQAQGAGTWPQRVPGAPIIGTATKTGQSTATVAFTAPADNGGATITSYTAVSSPGSVTATLSQAGSGTITVTGLTPSTSYTFTVYATNGVGNSASSAASNSITTDAARGEQVYNSQGTYTWIAPTGVTSVSVVCIGASGGIGNYNAVDGYGGAGLGWKNNIAVTPGSSYSLRVGAPGEYSTGTASGLGSSWFISSSTVGGYQGNNSGSGYGLYAGDGGGQGGSKSGYAGGGAGGYSGAGGSAGTPGSAGSGGGGGGGYSGGAGSGGGGGGGTGIYGQGANGAAASSSPNGGGGGSGGGSGTAASTGVACCASYGVGGGGGTYGGGGGIPAASVSDRYGSYGGGGVVRILWGTGRSFPSTDVGPS